ncbi:histidinol dehydrogenase [Clostridia bacterium]|nr:histidinol dehydrogenase [Clostridia bacterium]
MLRIIKGGDTEALQKISKRSQLDYGDTARIVGDIISDVRERGDAALFEYAKKFDGADISELEVSRDDLKNAHKEIGADILRIMTRSAGRVREFHEKQKRNGYIEPFALGELMGQLLRPLERVGVYVPGGQAMYPSSVIMNVIPAKVAGVSEIIMATPPDKKGGVSPLILAAAELSGVDRVFKMGGAQAVAAFAHGTQSVPKVDKITGPGNIYVALAKRAVYGYVSIDSIAGPSEILIIADETANPVFVAADLLSQAEHDELAAAILITVSEEFAREVAAELQKMTARLPRKEIIQKSLENYGAIIVTESIAEAVTIANRLAPEHLELCVGEPFHLLPAIKNAGAVFLGNYTPEPLGDYMAGPNHVLPTGGTARFFSPLGVDDFIKKTSVLSFGKSAFETLAADCAEFAEAEGLFAHANSIRVRL